MTRKWPLLLGTACLMIAWRLQAPPAGESPEQVYREFLDWARQQPSEIKTMRAMVERYTSQLARQGVVESEIARRVQIIFEQAQQREIERWNSILTSPSPAFNAKPNAFLVEIVKGVAPGRALDVGMGQGRNLIYLAQQGWNVTGFDPADRAVSAAREAAAKLGLNVDTRIMRDDEFDFGQEQWDLIVLSYVAFRHLLPRLTESLRPGGLLVVEAYHHDAADSGPVGAGVTFGTNELLQLFAGYRITHYEDTEDTADFGLRRTRLVRLCAQKEK